jgi:hypothetical protein
MPIVGGPNPFIVITDPVEGKRIDRIVLSATLNLSCFPACDGREILITRLTTQTVTPYYLETNTKGSTINIATNPVGIWKDGRFLWKISSTGSLVQVDLATATILDTIALPADVYAGLTGDGRFLWTMDTTSGNVAQIDPITGTIVGTFTRPTNSTDLHHDGRFLWFLTGAASTQGTIKQYDPATGTEIGSFNVTNYGLSDGPVGLCGDGRYLYNTELIQ